ncbi:MAG: urease subunit beta [Gemmataceae bacterium]|nr:urease subunit beta [Gemmataceae bacterium]
MVPGEYIFDGPDIELNPGRKVVTLSVTNTGDRPIQVGAHYHFFETNKALVFDRAKAYGTRLDLPSGTSVRFEPGDTKTVNLIPYGGARVVYGFNDLVDGRLDDPYTREASIKRCLDQKYGHKPS